MKMIFKLAALLTLALATTAQAEEMKLSHTYKFRANKPKIVENPAPFDLSIKCLIISKDQSNSLTGEMKAKSGSLNGVKLSKGQSLTITVLNGQTMKIGAKKGAQVQITNHGKNLVEAECTV